MMSKFVFGIVNGRTKGWNSGNLVYVLATFPVWTRKRFSKET
uniref:Uncharacterized protein n=1 Tax=Tetraselmis sp. GSL018 TaxID=582737 RepID=A0A061R9P5_9CHLO